MSDFATQPSADREGTLKRRARAHRGPAVDAIAWVAATLVLIAGLAFAFQSQFELDGRIIIVAPAVFGLVAGVALLGLSGHPHPRFGAGNAVTTLRAGLVGLFAAIAFTIDAIDAVADSDPVWLLVGIGSLAFVLDGLDGLLARSSGLDSSFGARYDMEVDALLILCLSGAVFLSGKAGPWVLLIGTMRYLFILAGLVVIRLRAPLPESKVRKAISVLQTATLLVALAPAVTASFADAVVVFALVLLTWSFGRDIVWLLQRGQRA